MVVFNCSPTVVELRRVLSHSMYNDENLPQKLEKIGKNKIIGKICGFGLLTYLPILTNLNQLLRFKKLYALTRLYVGFKAFLGV